MKKHRSNFSKSWIEEESPNNSVDIKIQKEKTFYKRNLLQEVNSEENEMSQNEIVTNSSKQIIETIERKDDDSDENLCEAKEKKRKKGLIYIANLPKHMNVTLIKEYLGQYGNIGRIYLQPDKTSMCRSKKRKNMARHFSEGWVEFLSKKVAKEIAIKLNNTQIGTRKKSKFYDSLWCIKYLPSFKWVHLSERLAYEQAVYKKRLMAEISQARKETDFFQQNLDKSEFTKKMKNKK